MKPLKKATLTPATSITNINSLISDIEVKADKVTAVQWSPIRKVEVDLKTKTGTIVDLPFQKCTTCNTDISYFYRLIREQTGSVAFVECKCDWSVLLAFEVKVKRLPVMPDYTRYYHDSDWHPYNRSAWSDGKRLVYCEKGTRTIVEYQWSDLEKGEVNLFKKIDLGVNSKVASVVLDGSDMSVLFRDGTLKLKSCQIKLPGRLL